MRQSGFTLVEMLTVIVIVGILATIAIPAYDDYYIRTQRTEGRTMLLQAQQGLERCMTRFGTYDNVSCDIFNALDGAGVTSENGNYIVTGAVNVADFALTATPQGRQATKDTKCANFTLDSAGVKGISGTSDVEECW